MTDQPAQIEDWQLEFPLRELKGCDQAVSVNLKFIVEKKLQDKLDDYRFLTDRLSNLAHKDILTSKLPLGFMSIGTAMSEVERDLNTSLALAFFHEQGGSRVNTLKPAFYLLRSALESTKTCIHYYHHYSSALNNDANSAPAMDNWIKGKENTPNSRILENIFTHEKFVLLENGVKFKTTLKKHERRLEDILHTKIRISGAHNINLFEYYLGYYFAILIDITILLSVFKPINILELPVFEKFGGNAPMILDDLAPELLRRILPANVIATLDKIAEQDSETQSLKAFVLAQPDLTKEEIDKSFDYLEELTKKPEQGL